MVFRFGVQATATDHNVNTVVIQNDASVVNFGTGIDSVEVYLDEDNDSVFETSDTLIGTSGFSPIPDPGDPVSILLQTPVELIAGGIARNLFIVYNVSTTAEINATSNVQLLRVIADGGVEATPNGLTDENNIIAITGFSNIAATDVAPNAVLPTSDIQVPMLLLSITADGEAVNEDTVQITIRNPASNFVTVTGNKNGIVRASLYIDDTEDNGLVAGEFDENDDLLDSIDAGEFTSSSLAVFSSLSGITFPVAGTRNIFVVYELGEDFNVTSDTTIQAQFTALSGLGRQSLLTLRAFNELPAPPNGSEAEAKVSGLTFGNLESIVPSNNTFGPDTVVPMLAFSLFGTNTAVTLNSVTVGNPGTIPFVTDPNSTSGITKIQIFHDTNGDGENDGLNSGDTLVGERQLGTQNSQTIAVVDIIPPFAMPQFNNNSALTYPENDEQKFFVVYHLGSNVLEGTSLSTKTVIASLRNASGTVVVDGTSVNVTLRGTLPAFASPNAQANLVDVNVSVEEVENISPTFAVQGQIKVPMLYMDILTDQDFPSATVTIDNESQTFLANSTGATKVWLYRDDVPNKQLDPGDTLIGSREVTSSGTPGRIDIFSVPLFQGTTPIMVMYDIGQIAQVTGLPNIRAQLARIAGSNNTQAIVFGGQVPAPNEAASVIVQAAKMNIPSVNATVGVGENPASATFNVLIDIQNLTTADIQLTKLIPRFYLTNVSGQDITSEFTIVTASATNILVSANSTYQASFFVRHTNTVSKGAVVVDGYAEYEVGSGQRAAISRYQGLNNVWFAAADITDQITLSLSPDPTFPWTFPSYVDSVYVGSPDPTLGIGQLTPFFSGDAVPANTSFHIFLKNNGDTINEGSIRVFLNDVELNQSSTVGNTTPGTFSYSPDTGRIVVSDVGVSDGFIRIQVTDKEGIALPDAEISFFISQEKVRIYNLLFYPNPYRLGEENLKLGFSITRPASIKMYLFNFQGYQVWENEFDAPDVGYMIFEIDRFSNFLRSGIYICKVIATDDDGQTAVGVTRLAIY